MPERAALIAYDRGTPPPAEYARPGALVAVDWDIPRRFPDRLREIRAGGGEVLMYCLPYHDYPYPDDNVWKGLFYTGQRRAYRRDLIPDEWFWDPAQPFRVNVPNYSGYVMNVRTGSPFVEHLATVWFPQMMAELYGDLIDGFLLDVWGTDWRGQTSGLTTSEKPVIEAGIWDASDRFRDAVGPDAILIGNNTWKDPHPRLNGLVMERHGAGESSYIRRQLAFGTGLPVLRRRNLFIQSSTSEACAWAALGDPNITHYAVQTSYDPPNPPALPYGPCGVGSKGWLAEDNHLGATAPPPPPPEPDPDPAPPPADGPTVTPSIPALPVVDVNPSGSVTVHRPDFPAADEVTTWQVYRDGAHTKLDLPMDVDTFTVAHAPGETHTYRTSGRNLIDYGDWSEPVTVSIPAPEPPPDPEPEPEPDPVAALKAAVAAETLRHSNAIAQILEGKG